MTAAHDQREAHALWEKAYGHSADNVCDLCGQGSEKLEVDHDHETDRIRGAVCRRCNFLLGVSRDDPERLRAAIAYLESPPRDGSYTAYKKYAHKMWRDTPEQKAKTQERNVRHRGTRREWKARQRARAAGL